MRGRSLATRPVVFKRAIASPHLSVLMPIQGAGCDGAEYIERLGGYFNKVDKPERVPSLLRSGPAVYPTAI